LFYSHLTEKALRFFSGFLLLAPRFSLLLKVHPGFLVNSIFFGLAYSVKKDGMRIILLSKESGYIACVI